MRPRGHRRPHHHHGGKDVEHRQRADQDILFGEQQPVAQPAVIDDPAIAVLRHFGQSRGATGMEIGADPVARTVGKSQGLGLLRDFGIEIQHPGLVRHRVFRAQKRHDELLDPAQIAQQVNFEHMRHVRGQPDRFRRLLGHLGLWERPQCHQHLGLGFTQDARNLVCIHQRIDRADDPRHLPAKIGQHRLVTIGQQIGHDIGFTDAERPEQIGGLGRLVLERGPAQGFLFRCRVGQ